MALDNIAITKAIIKSQHCQRNWDLTKDIPEEDMKVLITAATQCPSKQNIAHYKAHFITNRTLIESIHAMTNGFTYSILPERKTTTNTQTLANLLVVLESIPTKDKLNDPGRNEQTVELIMNKATVETNSLMLKDAHMAVGVAAGYINVTATLMGYSTGCCACFDEVGVKNLLKLENNPVLLMGVGYKDETKNRRIHHLQKDFVFPALPKQDIEVTVWN